MATPKPKPKLTRVPPGTSGREGDDLTTHPRGLLSAALEAPAGRGETVPIADDMIDLVLAFIEGKVTEHQCQVALGKKTRVTTLGVLSKALLTAACNGQVQVDRVED